MIYNIVIIALSSAIVCFILAYTIALKKLISLQKLTNKLYVENFTLEEYIKTLNNLNMLKIMLPNLLTDEKSDM